MKSRIIIIALSVVTLLAGAAIFVAKSSLPSLFLINVKALADATPVKTCYLESSGGTYMWQIFCDIRTSPEMIYPCNSEPSYKTASGTSLCTK